MTKAFPNWVYLACYKFHILEIYQFSRKVPKIQQNGRHETNSRQQQSIIQLRADTTCNMDCISQQQQQRPFNGLWSGTTRVGRYQKELCISQQQQQKTKSGVTFSWSFIQNHCKISICITLLATANFCPFPLQYYRQNAKQHTIYIQQGLDTLITV